MNLGVELGGAEAKLELGGLKIRKLHLESGLAGSKVSFSTPNQVPMERMSIELGLGGVQFEKLGNANVAEINIDGGMGAVSLDFGDVVGQDVKITSNFAFGELRVAVPANVGVLVEGELKAGKFERHIAFKQMGNAWYSMNWQDASQHITIVAHTTVGSLKIVPTGQ